MVYYIYIFTDVSLYRETVYNICIVLFYYNKVYYIFAYKATVTESKTMFFSVVNGMQHLVPDSTFSPQCEAGVKKNTCS